MVEWVYLPVLVSCLVCAANMAFDSYFANPLDYKRYMSERERVAMREKARKMFQFGFDNYMKHAYPKDELDPIHCKGRGHDHEDVHNININDALGDYMLTLVDSLDTLAVFGNASEFKKAVTLVINNLSFNTSNEVQVFEATIRVVGGLISAHLLIKDSQQPFGDLTPDDYDNQLLDLAHDLASRLLPSFKDTSTGIPYPRVNLMHGIEAGMCLYCLNETCTAGAGSLQLEFGFLSVLLDDPVYYSLASRAVNALWSYRSKTTGLLGNVINIQTGEWVGRMSGVGAGLDSLYEYLLKSAIVFGEKSQMSMFESLYKSISRHLRKGRSRCGSGDGHHPLYVNVDMFDGSLLNNWIDSLSAAWPAVQVLYGDVEEAVCSHLVFYSVWKTYEALPERYNWNLQKPELSFSPLRPELAESTYYLYRATNNPFYLDVGKDLLSSIEKYNKVKCGYATMHDVVDKTLEDRMESFFLSETSKYLFLLFDKENPLHRSKKPYIFSTEGHLLPISYEFREKLALLFDLPTEFYFNTNISGATAQRVREGYYPIDENYIHQIMAPAGSSQ